MSNDISKKKRLIVYDKYKGKCAYCGIKIKYEDITIIAE
jgi:hypothetical protein